MEKHVVIVDFNHMVHTYYNSQYRLHARVMDMGVPIEKDTTIANGALKNIFRWTKGGVFPTSICFDRPVAPRKVYFKEAFGGDKEGNGNYKGSRESMSDGMFEGSRDTQMILEQGGVPVFVQNGYEADDLIMACIQRAKVKYPGMHIDVVTNDADLLPLVDNTVSVYLRSKKGTYAVDKTYEKNKYIEVTPDNYQTVVEDLSAYKGFKMPYNILLLHKLLRGDSSDEFGCKDISRMFSPLKWNKFVSAMEEGGIDFANAFRYGPPVMKILYRGTDKEFDGTLKDALSSPDKAQLYQKVCNPVELDTIIGILRKYTELSEEQLSRVEKIYWGMNLNMVYPNKTGPQRGMYTVGTKNTPDISEYRDIDLHNAASVLQIRLLR